MEYPITSSPQSSDSPPLTLEDLQSWLPDAATEANRLLLKREQSQRIETYRPYKKQVLFHQLGRTLAQRLLRAGNQQGKTYAGGMEMAMHLTGKYHPSWPGRRFNHPIDAWACCDTGETTRDNPQRVLVGPIGAWGTGCIPSECIEDYKRGRGVADLLDTVLIRHASGGISRLGFKRYDQGREAFQGPSKHAIWCDEEPPEDVYTECLARLIATNGMVYVTFTPLMGMSKVVELLLDKPGDVNMTIDDAEHIPAEERARIEASFPEHEREARIRGTPVLGSGRVFPVTEASIKCEPILIPEHWSLIGGMDFGWDHPFAAVKLAWDKDADCVYVTNAYRVREQTPIVHVAAIKSWGKYLRWSWPHDGHQHDKGSGVTLASQYRAQGLKTLTHHATFPDGGYGLEAGIAMMLDRMMTGRLKVFANLFEWFEEFRLYHRKEGLIVKERDDLISATRVGLMQLRSSIEPQEADRAQTTAYGDYDVLSGLPTGRGFGRTVEQGAYDPWR